MEKTLEGFVLVSQPGIDESNFVSPHTILPDIRLQSVNQLFRCGSLAHAGVDIPQMTQREGTMSGLEEGLDGLRRLNHLF